MESTFESDVVGRPAPMVREESAADRSAVAEILRAAYGRDGETETDDDQAGDRDDDRQRPVDGTRAFVAVVSDHAPGGDMAGLGDGEVVGYLRLVPAADGDDVLVIDRIGVRPERQRQGVGTYLVQFALEMVADSGGARVVVDDDAPFWDRFGLARA